MERLNSPEYLHNPAEHIGLSVWMVKSRSRTRPKAVSRGTLLPFTTSLPRPICLSSCRAHSIFTNPVDIITPTSEALVMWPQGRCLLRSVRALH